MEHQVVEKVAETAAVYVDLLKIFVPVFFAFWLNRKLNKYHQKQNNLSDLMAIAVDYAVIVNHLANLKRDISVPRQKEVESYRSIQSGRIVVDGGKEFRDLISKDQNAAIPILIPQNIFLKIN